VTDGPKREDGSEPETAPPRLRYTRRRLLVVGGAALAGVAATVAGVKVAGGSGAPAGGAGASEGTEPGGDAPGGDFPVISVEHHPPEVPARDWIVTVDGLVDDPFTIDRAAWMELTRSSVTADLQCVAGWSVDDIRWEGVAPGVLFDRAGLRPEAKAVLFHAHSNAGGGYSSCLSLKLLTEPDTLLADKLDGAPLPSRHGGPLRLIVPSQVGYKNVKWVVRLEVTDHIVPGYWEKRGYLQDAPVRGR
jgi:DMSO/TMAO reductase YedYZ molybdopterin-dependent catalytic subunit